jgi:hypothetical protein
VRARIGAGDGGGQDQIAGGVQHGPTLPTAPRAVKPRLASSCGRPGPYTSSELIVSAPTVSSWCDTSTSHIIVLTDSSVYPMMLDSRPAWYGRVT